MPSRPGGSAPGKTISHIMLASPDIDIDLFRTEIAQLPESVRSRMYLFVSKDDGALLPVAADRRGRAAGRRVRRGGAGEVGVTVIDLSEIADSASGSHSKFAGSPGGRPADRRRAELGRHLRREQHAGPRSAVGRRADPRLRELNGSGRCRPTQGGRQPPVRGARGRERRGGSGRPAPRGRPGRAARRWRRQRRGRSLRTRPA